MRAYDHLADDDTRRRLCEMRAANRLRRDAPSRDTPVGFWLEEYQARHGMRRP